MIHGVEVTGKSSITKAVLEALPYPFAIVRSQECITTRHLLERTLAAVNDAFSDERFKDRDLHSVDGRCESISAFVVQLQQMIARCGKVILVFDGIDRQREAAPTLLPAIARLGEVVRIIYLRILLMPNLRVQIQNLTVVLIVTVPRPRLLHQPGLPHIHFPQYTRAEALEILSLSSPHLYPPQSSTSDDEQSSPPPQTAEDSQWLWSRFCGAVWDSLGQGAARDILSFRSACSCLWKPFTEPILKGDYGIREFSKLMVRNRALFQSEAALTESIVAPNPMTDLSTNKAIKGQSCPHSSYFPPEQDANDT